MKLIFNAMVDAGCILIANKEYFDKYGYTPNDRNRIIDLPIGSYKFNIKGNTWLGELNIEKELNVTSSIVIGDPCYGFKDTLWKKLLDDTNYFKNINEKDGFVINTGGDGDFKLNITILES